MSVRDDQLIYEYLGKVADESHGRMPALARQDLVEKVRHEIEDRRRRAGKTDITQVLQSMGDPRALVDRAIQIGGSEYAGYRPPTTTASANQPAPAVATGMLETSSVAGLRDQWQAAGPVVPGELVEALLRRHPDYVD